MSLAQGLFATLMLISFSAYAQETPSTAPVKELAEVLGFESMMKELRDQTQQSTELQVSQMMGQFERSFPQMPESFMKELSEAATEFAQKVSTAWDPSEAARIYSSGLSEALSEDEMREAIKHYGSAEGQRQLKAINEAAGRMNTYVLTSINTATEQATQDFIQRLQLLAEKARREQEASRGN
jgi:hypothetical protein